MIASRPATSGFPLPPLVIDVPTNSVATTGASWLAVVDAEVVDPVRVDVAGQDDGVGNLAVGEELDQLHPLGGVAGPLVH